MDTDLVDRFLQALNSQDFSALELLLAEDFVFEEVASAGERSREALIEELGMIIAGFSDLVFRSVRLAPDAGRLIVEFRAMGTHRATFLGVPATDRFVVVSGVFNLQISADKVCRLRLTIDFAGLRRQLLLAARRP